ncbi:CHAT domain-containing protein [Streptomyces sp. IBSBF 3136]|uniref:CHAT domain-containing protein n=1 Tax=Streptomyces sp. IBSBF 3136 TaxID=2903524 RepID=UPI002FDC58CB
MSQHGAPTPPDRSPYETLLRTLLDEAMGSGGLRIDAEARAAIDDLLADGTRDRKAFEWELERILAFHDDFAELWDTWRESRDAGLRGATGSPPVHGTDVPGPRVTGRVPERTAPGEEPDEEPGTRVLNLCLTWPLSRCVVPPETALAAGRRYELRIDIGDLARESLLAEHSRPFPDDQLPHDDDNGRGDRLDVVVLSDDFTVAPERHPYFLPLTGSGWVCLCPDDATMHTCEPHHRSKFLRIPVTAPYETGPSRLRVIVTHRGNQLQSASVTAWVASKEQPGVPASAVIDFTLTAGFAALATLPQRSAGIRIGHGTNGAVTVDVLGTGAPISTFRLTELQVLDALNQTRDTLDHVHAEATADGTVRNRLLPGNRKEAREAAHDLFQLAQHGWRLLTLLAPHAEQRAGLSAALDGPAEIQICRENSQDIMFPWTFVYDIPIDGNHPPKLCTAGGRAVAADLDARSCPDADSHGYNTLCPFGFWGFRHLIEQPPSLLPGRRLPLYAGRGGDAPHMTVARSLTLNQHLSEQHMAALRETFRDEVTDCADRVTLQAALKTGQHDCVYFYCHGRRPDTPQRRATTTVLEIGHTDRIEPSALATWQADSTGWRHSTPLIFLNGCHTADIDPTTWLGFVDAFSGLYASGTVGTEISVEQALATEVAERFWQHFLAGENVGTALHRVRTGLLRKGNVLGLAYTAYCSNSLRLRGDVR